jgi:hypothetical protein
MSRNPRVTGDGLIAALEKVGFRVLRLEAAITFCVTRMAGARLCRCTLARPSAPVCSTEPSETVN